MWITTNCVFCWFTVTYSAALISEWTVCWWCILWWWSLHHRNFYSHHGSQSSHHRLSANVKLPGKEFNPECCKDSANVCPILFPLRAAITQSRKANLVLLTQLSVAVYWVYRPGQICQLICTEIQKTAAVVQIIWHWTSNYGRNDCTI